MCALIVCTLTFQASVQAAIASSWITHGRGIVVMWMLLEPMAHLLQDCWQ